MFGFSGKIVKYSFVSTGVITAGGLGFLYNTKPSHNSFKKFLSKREMTNIKLIDNLILGVEIKDYMFFNIATISAPGASEFAIYIGAVHEWKHLDNELNINDKYVKSNNKYKLVIKNGTIVE